VRSVVGLIVSAGLALSAVSLAPMAVADTTPSGSAAPSGDATSGTAPAPTPAAGSTSPSSSPQTASPTTTAPRSLASASPTPTRPAPIQDPTLDVTVDTAPTSISVDTTPSFTYHVTSVVPGVEFTCTLTLNGVAQPAPACNGQTALRTDGTLGTRGGVTLPVLATSSKPYVLSVTADVPPLTPADGGTVGRPGSASWRIYSVTAPASYVPATGASFNNPLGDRAQRRANLDRVIKTINSMPGYAEPAADPTAPCPSDTSPLVPSTIKITAYSMTDLTFARAMAAADSRCVRTQMLMNNHLTVDNDPAWRLLQDALGNNRNARSFAIRCSHGCRGDLLHTKMYTFDSSVPAPLASRNRVVDTVMFGSSNMTGNASGVQWNDLYAAHDAKMYADWSAMFDLMKQDDGFHRNPSDFVSSDGTYRSTFWPVAANRTEPYVAALRSIRCSGATGGTGINGHSVVYINMHAWFGVRGLEILQAVRKLYSQGCYIRVLYSFMTPAVYRGLTKGTTSRLTARRTQFSLDGDKYADVYSHFKNITASGNIAGKSANRVVWTGSNNFTSDGSHFDEVMVRIASASAYRAYRDRFAYITKRKSSGTYAQFLEPVGGGRVPKQSPQAQLGTTSQTPLVLSPGATRDANGNPQVAD